MLRQLKTLLVLGLMAVGLQSSWAFSLLGPIHDAEPWQTADIGYQPGGLAPYDRVSKPNEGVRQIGQEYRRNVPILYYSADVNFREFFGNRGVQEVDKAMAVYNSLTNVSSYSADLSEFPTDVRREHLQAAALGLVDLKSTVIYSMTSQLGLTSPERYVWGLSGRVPGPACPVTATYSLVRRNFDIVPSALDQFQASSYVNGTLYSFFIYEDCGATPTPDADAVEFPVDPLASTFTSVANPFNWNFGYYLTHLTRDDVAGLRYLLRSSNINLEPAGTGVEAFVTNAVSPTPLPLLDLGLLLAQARTNNAEDLQALFPGLITTATLTGFEIVTNTVVSFIITTNPYAPAYVDFIVPVTNRFISPIPVPVYQHTFQNVITNQFSTHSIVTVETISFGNDPYAPAYFPPTLRQTSRTYLTNQASGSFFLIPEGFCSVTVLSNILTTVVTNISTIIATNTAGVTNVGGIFFIQNTFTYFTNQALAYIPISCETNLVDDYQGLERLRFVHINDDMLDPLTGLYRIPFTSQYTLTAVNPTNKTTRPVRMRRVVSAPDFLFTAEPILGSFLLHTVQFNSDFAPVNQAGPGTIDSLPVTISFDSMGPEYFGGWGTLAFLEGAESSLSTLAWASFDGTTNAPVVYPNGTSIAEFEYFRLLQVTPVPPFLTGGKVGVAYDLTLGVNNAQGPVTWSFAPASPGLPAGLTLTAGGHISGVPSMSGTYDFTLRMTDGAGRFIDIAYEITISP